MKKLVRLTAVLGESVILQMVLATPVSAQTATGSSSTSSSLPEAGTGSVTMFLVLFGLALATVGLLLSLKQAKQEA